MRNIPRHFSYKKQFNGIYLIGRKQNEQNAAQPTTTRSLPSIVAYVKKFHIKNE